MNSQYKILNAYFVETGTCPDMSARNLMTQIGTETMKNFEYRTNGGKFLTPDNMSGVAGSILVSDPNGERLVNLPNGFEVPRLRFLLRVGIPGQVNGVVY